MQHIETVTVGAGGAASITFSAIPDSFTDLLILFSGRVTENTTAVDIAMTFNGSTSGYSGRTLYGTGSSVGSDSESGSQFSFLITFPGNSATANTFGNAAIYIPNYLSSAAKSVSIDGVMENNATAGRNKIAAGLWNNTAAITSVTLDPGGSGSLSEFSSASLYGIRKYNTTLAPKASGGIISYDAVNNKWVHVFTASGTFTPTQNLSGVEYLVVAGGGGAGTSYGGGGGAGGYRSSVFGELSGQNSTPETALTVNPGSYPVVVGAGGSSYTSGSNSSAFGIVSIGGGRGGVGNPQSISAGPEAGGSGGGDGGYSPSTNGTNTSGGAGTSGQGFSGGNSTSAPTKLAGGGGGAGQAGANATTAGTPIAGKGGDGIASSITGVSIYRAGGGGGGAGFDGSEGLANVGGLGGGGNGSNTTAGQNGVANTGGGGGGGDQDTTIAASGGSGIVIVRYSA